MTTPRPNRGWLAKLQDAMAPLADPDDASPIVRPRSITIAVVFGALAAVLILFSGVSLLASADRLVGDAVKSNEAQLTAAIKQCTDDPAIGGIGSAVPSTISGTPTLTSPIAATSMGEVCRKLTSDKVPADQIASAKTQLRVFSVVFILVGLGIGAASYYLRRGAKWARRGLIAAALVMLLITMMIGMYTMLTLIGMLLAVVALVLIFVGKGGMFFARVANQRKH